MTVVVKIIGYADGSTSEHDGRYLAWWDVAANNGFGSLGTVERPADAFHFRDARNALAAWRSIPSNHPRRLSDGKPNRPLTAFSVEVIDLARALTD